MFLSRLNEMSFMCQFFEKSGYPVSVVQAGHHHVQLIDGQSSLQTSQKEHSDHIRVIHVC